MQAERASMWSGMGISRAAMAARIVDLPEPDFSFVLLSLLFIVFIIMLMIIIMIVVLFMV